MAEGTAKHNMIKPIPFSERKPAEADCIDVWWCWAIGLRGDWNRVYWKTKWENTPWTHWLPWWALPLPEDF